MGLLPPLGAAWASVLLYGVLKQLSGVSEPVQREEQLVLKEGSPEIQKVP